MVLAMKKMSRWRSAKHLCLFDAYDRKVTWEVANL